MTKQILNALLVVFMAGFGVIACGGGDDNGTCTPGETQTCNCTASQLGVQTCLEDDKGWSPCQGPGCVALPGGDTTQPPGGDTMQPPADTGAPETTTPPDDNGQQCFTQHEKQCVGKDVYWFDSCGNQETKLESCDIGCSAGECAQGCVPKETVKCVDGQPHFFDSCGVDGGVYGAKACDGTQFCKDTATGDPDGIFCVKPYYNGKWKLTGTGSSGCTWADQVITLTVSGSSISGTADVTGAAIVLEFDGTLDGKAFTMTAEYDYTIPGGGQSTSNTEVIDATFSSPSQFEGVDTHTYVQYIDLSGGGGGGCFAEICGALGGTCDGDLCGVAGLCYYNIVGTKM